MNEMTPLAVIGSFGAVYPNEIPLSFPNGMLATIKHAEAKTVEELKSKR